MIHSVLDFEMEDNYSSPPSSGVHHRPKKPSLVGDEGIVELLWQNGQVVMQSQNHRPYSSLKKSPLPPPPPPKSSESAVIPAEASIPPQEESAASHLLMPEDDMASWLNYHLDSPSFDRDLCTDFLYPTTLPAHSPDHHHRNPPPPPPPPPPKPPIPPGRPSELHGSGTSDPSRWRESTVVDSSETPPRGSESRVSITAAAGSGPRGGSSGVCGERGNAATAEVTVTSSSGGSGAARKDDVSGKRDNNDSLWQVDVDMMDALFTSLVEYLQLEKTYNIFILNPKRDGERATYGYRRGLSESEINFLAENKTLQTKILQSGSAPESFLGKALDKMKRPLYEKHPMAKFSWTLTEDTDTAEWFNICLDALNSIEKWYEGKDISDIIVSKVIQLLKGQNEDMKLFLEKQLKSGDFSGLHAECLTDAWIAKDRWAFIDLSAGPFSWGPAVGGEGVRTELSLPNVEKTIGAVAEISEDEAEDHLQEAIQEKFAIFGDKDHEAVDILLAEIDIYELFAFKHCKGRKVKLALCAELDERMRDLKIELQSFDDGEYDESHKRKATDALKRMENWNLFSDSNEEFQNYTVARDTFLAHLGATLWGSMRHIISPSIADGAFHHYEKIAFQLFFITQEKTGHIKQLPVDLKAIMDGLSSLLLPSQKVMFSPHMLSLSEDPALAMAFSVARRAAAVPLLLVNGTYRKTVRSYLDSSILQRQLRRLDEHSSLKGMHASSRSTVEVPIFWFIHGDPLLVDKHYQAKALSDMVIVVQSEQPSWESHLQCNGQSLLWDLRKPVKAALATTAEHLAGLLPLHLVYSQAHENAIEDWIWSAGCNPFSITSQGWHISRFQSDTIARSYIITALEESIQLVNSAIHLLVMEQTSEQTFKLFKSHERELVSKYNYVVGLWRRISAVTGELRYVDAVSLLRTLEDASKGFADYVNTTIAHLHPIHCTRERKVHVEFDTTTIPAFLVVLGILWIVLRPRRPKPKIN